MKNMLQRMHNTIKLPETYEWVSVYQKLANTILKYKNNRPKLIEIIKAAYSAADIKLPTLTLEGEELTDICPFSFFALFNKKQLDKTREQILHALLDKLGINAACPSSFEGIPVLNPLMATFYWFDEQKGERDIDNLWDMFEIAIRYADKPTIETEKQFKELYNTCQQQKGVKWNLTMGFYWIRPNYYLTLDGRTRWYIETSQEFPDHLATQAAESRNTVPDADEYLQITNDVKNQIATNNAPYHDLVSFSYYAWLSSEKTNKMLRSRVIKYLTVDENGRYNVDIDITVNEWKEMLSMDSIFYPDALNMVLAWYKKPGHSASSKEIMAETHPELKGTPYNGTVKSLGKRIIEHLNRFEVKQSSIKETIYERRNRRGIVQDIKKTERKGDSYWCIPFEGWHGNNGQFIWKVRDELARAIEELGYCAEPETNDLMANEENAEIYTKEDFLNEVYISAEQYEELREQLLRKKNIILQGAPGVGKTYSAKRLAWSIMGNKNENHIKLIQFHQSYGYEDFMMGYRPCDHGFTLKTGPFYNFCKQAAANPAENYFFIIDEINRGNLSKIFGELFMLMENDKRGEKLTLLYTDEEFSIPKNLHIIGMMNTADRSLAMLDYALRRRFAFFELEPAFQSKGFKSYQTTIQNSKFDKLIATIEHLNQEISENDSLGRGFRIGHSYFCSDEPFSESWLQSIINYEIIPLLEEYWFDEPDTVEKWKYSLTSSIQ